MDEGPLSPRAVESLAIGSPVAVSLAASTKEGQTTTSRRPS